MAHPQCIRPWPDYQWTAEDYAALRWAASELGVKSEDLLLVFELESGRNPHAANCWPDDSWPNAVGLNQIVNSMPRADKPAYLKLTAAQQMPRVVSYFKSTGRNTKGADVVTLYQLNLAPGTVPNEVIFRRDDPKNPSYYAANKGLDVDGDGVITRADLSQVLAANAKHAGFKRALAELGGQAPVISASGMTRSDSVAVPLTLAAGAGLIALAFLRKKR